MNIGSQHVPKIERESPVLKSINLKSPISRPTPAWSRSAVVFFSSLPTLSNGVGLIGVYSMVERVLNNIDCTFASSYSFICYNSIHNRIPNVCD